MILGQNTFALVVLNGAPFSAHYTLNTLTPTIINAMKKLNQNLISLCIISIASLSIATAQPTGVFTHTYEERSTGAVREIACYVPETYNSTRQYPLIFFWHGSNTPATEWQRYLRSVCSELDVMLACPDWNDLNSQPQLLEMIGNTLNYFAQNYSMDTSRYIISGHSAGSQLAYLMGLNSPYNWKGIVNVNPAIDVNFFSPQHWENFNLIKSVMILGSHDANYHDAKLVADSVTKITNKSLYIEKAEVEHYDTTYLGSGVFRSDVKQAYFFIMGTTGLSEELKMETSLNFYPNPAHGNITLKLRFVQGVSTLQLISADGRLVKTYTIPESSHQLNLDISDVPPGLYHARVPYESGVQVYRMIIE